MAALNENERLNVEVEEIQGQLQGPDERKRIHLREGLYFLANKRTRTLLDLNCGNPAPGTLVIAYQKNTDAHVGNQLWILKQDGLDGTYTLRNFQGGTFLELGGGTRENGSGTSCSERVINGQNRSNQEWRVEEHEPHHYRLRCSRTDTFLEVAGGKSSNGAHVTCSEATGECDHQLWCFESVSRTSGDIKALFESWKPSIVPRLLHPYGDLSQYFVLPVDLRKEIWQNTNLLRQPIRPHLFDYDDFVILLKNSITVWARDRFQADVRGYSVLFGIIYGEANKGPRAYNWYLSADMCSLVFFDAQSGNEYGPAALDSFGFEPTFAMF